MNDLINLFLADLNRAMDGLRQGIAQGPDGMTQASLHARDLSDALQSVNLPRHAEIALVISRHLAAGRPGMDIFTDELLDLVGEAIEALNTADEQRSFPNQDQLIGNLARAVSLFGEQPADFSSLAFQSTADSSRPAPASDLAPEADAGAQEQTNSFAVTQSSSSEQPESQGMIDLEEVTTLMYFPGQETESPLARVPLSSELSGPDTLLSPKITLHDRLYAFKHIQALDHEIAKSASPELAHQARVRLTDHANWIMALAQEPLQRRMVGMARSIELSGLRADADVIDYMISAMSGLPQPSAIRGAYQQQTLFVDLIDISPDNEALERASRIVQILAGRIDPLTDGLRLILPSSLSRLRVVPFKRNGLSYAVSWAQFLKAETIKDRPDSAEDLLGAVDQTARLALRIKSGSEMFTLYADEIGAFEVANAFLLPPSVEAPDWVAGVLVAGEPEPVVWIVPANS
ncbi:MAG: hypothetical protein FGM18_05055 [Burkholderiaceae bacterium]|nr:hypothetical protein [Burkholderiaceae bacterium]